MASIIKRKKNYSIVYTYVDENGETKQKRETRTSYQEALNRKAEIESQKSSNSFLPPTNQNIAEFLSDFVSLYGEKRWGVSMYDSQNSLIANYINPIIGDMKVQDITTRVVDKYIQTLQKTPAVNTRTHHAKTEFVTNAKQREEHTPTAAEYSFRKCTAWDCVPQVERQGAAPEKHQGQIGFPDADRDYIPQDRCFLLLLHQERSLVSHGARPVPIGQEIQQIQTPPSRWLFYLQNYRYTTRTVSRFSSPNQLG